MDFSTWLETGPVGSKYVYHYGFLATARDKVTQVQANLAWQAYEAGLVTLMQKKISDGQYLYFAQKRRKRR